MNPANSSSPKTENDQVVVFFNESSHRTEFDGRVAGVEVNGVKLNDIHDLTIEVKRQAEFIKRLACICGILAFTCFTILLFLAGWLASRSQSIDQLLTINEGLAEIRDADKMPTGIH